MSASVLALTDSASAVKVYGVGTAFSGKYQNGSSWSDATAIIPDARMRVNGVMVAQVISCASNDSALYVIKSICSAGGAQVTLSGVPNTPASLIVGYIYMPIILEV